MSRWKIGSVTDAVGENGTRWIHSRTVSHAPETEPPMMIAKNSARPPRIQPASGRRSGMSVVSKTIGDPVERTLPNGSRPPPNGDRVLSRRESAAWAASLSRSNSERNVPPPADGGGDSRPASQRLPSSTTSATRKAPMPSPTVAVSRVQKTGSKPTLAYHSTSVHRSIPTLNSRKMPSRARRSSPMPRRRPARAARLPAPSFGPPGPRRRGPPRRRRASEIVFGSIGSGVACVVVGHVIGVVVGSLRSVLAGLVVGVVRPCPVVVVIVGIGRSLPGPVPDPHRAPPPRACGAHP